MKQKVAEMHKTYPFKNSPQSLTFESEIKRVAKEREDSIEKTIENLSEMSGVTVRQIYNYRNGVTDIPSGLIPIFCKQFGSNALAMSILNQCGETEKIDDYDIVRLANQSAQKTLKVHQDFLVAFEDGKVDGFELMDLKKSTATSVACFHLLEQIAEDNYNRKRAA